MRREHVALLAGLLLVSIFMPLAATGIQGEDASRGQTRASTIIVAKDGTGDYSTIQEAVDSATSGDTIRIYDGVYKESVDIFTKLEIIGNGTANTILDGDGTLDHQHLFHINADDVNVSRIQFREGSPHHEFAGIGIYSTGCNIHHNHFYDNNIGIYMIGSLNGVENNTFDSNGYGIRSDFGADLCTVRNNDFNSSTIGAIIYMDGRGTDISFNSFNENRNHLSVFRDQDFNIGYNLFNKSERMMSGASVYQSSGCVIHNNTFIDNQRGLTLSDNTGSTDVMDNDFLRNEMGVWGYTNSTNVVLHRNSFMGNSLYGLNCSGSMIRFNATLNYWGNYTGPYHPTMNPSGTGDNVSDNADFIPWLLGEFENNPPVLDYVGDLYVDEDSNLFIPLNGTDPEQQDITFRIHTNASWLQFDPLTWNLTGIPGNLDVGSYFVNINITDGLGGYDEENITLTVNNTLPVLLTSSLPDGAEDTPYSFTIEHEDEEGSLLELNTNATWLTFNRSKKLLSGFPLDNDVGSFWANITLNDGNGGLDHANLTFSIVGVDDAPFIDDPLENIEMMEDTDHLLDLSGWVIDVDDDVLGYSFTEGENITYTLDMMNQTVLISPSPNWNGFEMVKITAILKKTSLFQTILITVIPVNDAPYDLSIGISDDHIEENESFFINGSAEDPDIGYGDKLNFTWYSTGMGDLGTDPSFEISLLAGSYLVWMNVTDEGGSWKNISREVTVHETIDDTVIPDDNKTDPDDNTTEPDDPVTDDDDDNTTVDDDDTPVDTDDDIPIDNPEDEGDGSDDDTLLFTMLIIGTVIGLLILILMFVMMGRSRREELDWEE